MVKMSTTRKCNEVMLVLLQRLYVCEATIDLTTLQMKETIEDDPGAANSDQPQDKKKPDRVSSVRARVIP